MLLNVPGKGNVELDIPDDVTQEELDALTPLIEQQLNQLPEEQQQQAPEETDTDAGPQVETWEDYQAKTNFEAQDFEKRKELFDTWRGNTIRNLEPTGVLQTAVGRQRLNEQFSLVEKSFGLNRPDRSFSQKYIFDLQRLGDSFNFGYKQFELSEATEELEKATLKGDKEGASAAAERIKSLNAEIANLPAAAATPGEIFNRGFLPNIQSALAEQSAMLYPKLLTNADAVVGQTAAGAGIGAGVGAMVGGVGAVPGAVTGAGYGFRTGIATATGKSSYELEYSNQLLGLLSGDIQRSIRAKNEERVKNGQEPLKDPTPGFDGIDINNPDQLLAAIQNEELMGLIKKAANDKGLTVGAVDGLTAMLTFGLAGQQASAAKKAGLLGVSKARKMGNAGVLFSSEILGGMGGEALSQITQTGDVNDPNAIAMEGVLEIPGALPVIAAAKGVSRADLVAERLRNYAPQTSLALAMADFRNKTNLSNRILGEAQELNALPFSFDRKSFDSIYSGLNPKEQQASFNRSTKLVQLALKEAYNVLGLNPNKPMNVRFSDKTNLTFSFDPAQENTILINPDALQKDLSDIDAKTAVAEKGKKGQSEKRRQTYLISALSEELIHDLDVTESRKVLYQRAVDKGEVDPNQKSFSAWRRELGEKGAEQMTEKEVLETRRAYGNMSLSGNELYSEFLRQLIQKKKIGVTTEETWKSRSDLQKEKGNILEESLLTAKDYWQKAVRGLSGNSPVVKEHLRAINGLLNEKQKVESALAKEAKKSAATATATQEPEAQEETVVETGENTQTTITSPATKSSQESATPVPTAQPKQVAKKQKQPKVNTAALKRWQARGKYGSVQLQFPDQESADAYDAGRQRDGKNKKRDSATLQKLTDLSKKYPKERLKLREYRQFIRDSIVKAEEGELVAIPSFQEFTRNSQPKTEQATETVATKEEAKVPQTEQAVPVEPKAEEATVTGEEIARESVKNRNRLEQLRKKESFGDTLTPEEKRERQDILQANRKMTEELNRRQASGLAGDQKAPFTIPKVQRSVPDVAEPTLALPEDEETLGAASPRGKEKARAQYFSSIDAAYNLKEGEQVNPNADKILDRLINDPELVNEVIKYFAGYIRNNPIYKIELEQMGIKSPSEVASEAMLSIMAASREISFPENGTREEQKTAIFRTIKNKLAKLINPELEESISNRQRATPEQIAEESDVEMEQEAEVEMTKAKEQVEENEQGITEEEEDTAENAPVISEKETISSVNPETGEARMARTADWGDTLGKNLPDTIENQEVPEFSDTAFDESGQVVVSVDPDISQKIARENLRSIGDIVRGLVSTAPFTNFDKKIWGEIWAGNADVSWNPYARQIEIQFVETERDRLTGRAVPPGERKKRQRSRERIAKWMTETLRPSLLKEIGDLRFTDLSPTMLKKLGLNRYRLGDVLGASKIKPSEQENKLMAVLGRLPDWEPFWLGPSGEIIPVESAVVRMEGMNDFDSHAGEMVRWLQENKPELYDELQKKYGYSLGKNINKEMMDRGWLRTTNDGNNLMVEGKPGRDQINLLTQKAISMELGLVHDKWPAKSKILFKPLSGKEISDVVSEMDIFGAAKVAVAAYRDKSFKTISNAQEKNEKRLAGRKANIQKLAETFGVKLSNVSDLVGGWHNPEIGSQLEPSMMITMEEGDPEIFAALLATNPFSTPQSQRAVYLFDTNVNNPTDTEYEVVFKDISGLNKFVANAEKLGFGEGFSIDPNSKTLYLGVRNDNEQAQSNVKAFFEGYKDYISEARSELGQLKIIDEQAYPELLGKLGDKIQDIENDFSKGLASYFIGASRTALARGTVGESTSPQANRRIRGWNKAAASAKLLRQAKEASQGAFMTDHLYVNVDKDAAKKIAEAYEQMPDFDPSERVKAAYEALAREVNKQWDYATKEMGVKFEPWTQEGQPYKSSSQMIKDVRQNNHLYYFTGGETHPYLGAKDEAGVSLNDKLRAIHDLFGHAAEGYGFGPRGEENAWIKHSQMFSDLAQKALTTETRGQNSWFNFGPHRFSLLGADIKTEKGSVPYAKQKVGLLPEEFTKWKQIPEVELSLLAKSLAPLSAPSYDPVTGKKLPKLSREEMETIPDKLFPGKRLKYQGVVQDDLPKAPVQEEPAPWELGAAEINYEQAPEGFYKALAGFNFPLRRMQSAYKLFFARKIESENYWTDVVNKNRNLRNVVSDLSAFEDNAEVLDFWNKLLDGANSADSFEASLLKSLNSSDLPKEQILANTASLFKVPLMKARSGEAFVPMPVFGGNVGIVENNGKLVFSELSNIVPDEGYLAITRLDANKFASGIIPVLPEQGTPARALFETSISSLASPEGVSPTALREAASEVSKYIPAQDLVRFLQETGKTSERQAKDIVYGNVLHAAKITPVEPSEFELMEVGAIPFNAERPVTGLLTSKAAIIPDGDFESISELELFSKKDLNAYKKSWVQIKLDNDGRVMASSQAEPSQEQKVALAKIITYGKMPVFLNGRPFDYKSVIRQQAFIDNFAERIRNIYTESDITIDENGNPKEVRFDNPSFSAKNYNLFRQMESFRNSGEAFDYAMEQALAMLSENPFAAGKFAQELEALRMAFKGNSVPAVVALLTHQVLPGVPQGVRDFIVSRLPYFLNANPSSEAYNLVIKTKEFKDWFGLSKATRPDGTPAIHYYMATSDISSPNTSSQLGGAKTYSPDQFQQMPVKEEIRRAYKEDSKPRVSIPVFVKAENPLRLADISEAYFDGNALIKDSVGAILAQPIAEQTGQNLDAVKAEINKVINSLEEESYKQLASPKAFANTFFKGVAKAFGFDSIELGSKTSSDKAIGTQYLVFDPSQIKLANGLNSDFSNSSDVLGAAKIEGFKYIPEDVNRFDVNKVPFLPRFAKELLGKYVTNADKIFGLRRFWQDRFIDLKKIQESIEQQTGELLPDSLNAYQLEELYHGKVGARLTDFNENIVEPLLQYLRDSGISVAEIEEYMYALHAQERNERIRLINPIPDEPYNPGPSATPEEKAKYEKAKKNKEYIEALHDKGSGMTDSEADDIIAKYRNDSRAENFEKARQMIRQMIDGSLKQRLDDGLISQALYDALTERYQNYVPLKGIPGATAEEIQTSGQSVGQGFNIRGEEVKPTLGRLSKAENILAYAVNSGASGIVRAEKNTIGNAIYELVNLFPDPDLWEIAQPETIRRLVTRKNPDTGEVFQYARNFVDPTWMNRPDIFATKINGETKFVRIKNADLIRNLKNGGLNSEHWSSKILSGLATYMRFLSLTRTGLNPEFIFTNPIRDLQTAAMNLSGEQYRDLASRVVKSVASLKPLRTSIAEEFNPGSTMDEWGESYRAFVQAGGKLIGWMTGDIETQINQVKVSVDGKDPNAFKRYWDAAAKWVEKANGGMENGTRLAVFHHARQMGLSDQQAAALARNATVNFTKKGEAGPVFNSLYLFFNASLQGSARLVQAVTTSPKVRKMAVGAVVSGAVTSMFNEALGGDDEDGESWWSKVPEFKKRTNIIIMIPNSGGKYVSLPLPYGYNAFWHTGNILSDQTLGKKSFGSNAARMAETVLEAFNPIGGARNLLSAITPTAFQPVTDIYLNQDWAGRPIVPSDFPGDPSPTPASEKYFNSVTPVFKHLTGFLNEITGGNEVREGAISISPEYLDYFASYLTGAVGSTILRTISLPEKILNPNEDLGLNDIPLVRKFVNEQPSYADYERFATIKQAVYTAKAEQDMFEEQKNYKARNEARKKYKAELSVYEDVQKTTGRLQNLKKDIEALRDESERTGKDNSKKIRQLKDKKKEAIMEVSKAYREALEKYKD